MTAFVLPNLDQSTIDELRKRIPDMSEFDIPKLEKVGKDVGKSIGKTADQTLDKLLGRSNTSVWPWVAGSLALAAIVGAVAAWFTWFRRPSSVDTLVEDEAGAWVEPVSSSIDASSMDATIPTSHTLDRETQDTIDSINAIGTFGDRTADEYPAAER